MSLDFPFKTWFSYFIGGEDLTLGIELSKDTEHTGISLPAPSEALLVRAA